MKTKYLLFFLLLMASTPSHSQYQVSRTVFGSGGTLASGAGNRVNCTLGQPIAGIAATPAEKGWLGFWHAAAGVKVDVDPTPPGPSEALLENYPNPFRSATTIRFVLRRPSRVTLTIVDLYGRQRRMLSEREYPAGSSALSFAPDDLPSGTYVVICRAGPELLTRKIVVMK